MLFASDISAACQGSANQGDCSEEKTTSYKWPLSKAAGLWELEDRTVQNMSKYNT